MKAPSISIPLSAPAAMIPSQFCGTVVILGHLFYGDGVLEFVAKEREEDYGGNGCMIVPNVGTRCSIAYSALTRLVSVVVEISDIQTRVMMDKTEFMAKCRVLSIQVIEPTHAPG